jgi:23S rRNA pseudouridine1911/1915/1917 synthase
MLVAKTKGSYQYLKTQFQNRMVFKNYHAIVWNNFPKMSVGESTIIDKPIGRSASDFRKWSAEFGAKGELRDAITEFNLIAQNKEYAYLSIFPKTGRTHQIRVHMKSIGHPVVCDKMYGPKKENNLGLERLALHALSIQLTLPNSLHVKIESSLPPEFMNARSIIEK